MKLNCFFKVICKDFTKSLLQVNSFYENIILPVLTQEQKQDCQKKGVIDALKSLVITNCHDITI